GRGAQRVLARDITARAHGEAATAQAEADSEALFSGGPITDPAVLASLYDSIGGFTVRSDVLSGGVAAVLAEAGVVASRGEARRLVSGGGIVVNGTRSTDPSVVPEPIAG